MNQCDVIIVGAGVVGLTTALILSQKTSLNIVILDSHAPTLSWQKNNYDHRVSAILYAAKNIFQNLQVWEKMANKRVSPYLRMHVWDEKSQGKICFDSQELKAQSLGYIVEESVMRTSLYEALKHQSKVQFFHPIQLHSMQEKTDCMELIAENNSFQTKLIIAADGANSWVREQANINLKTWEYNHTAIVTTVQTELSHQQTAWQRFLTTGPLAFLPLNEAQTSSIVWSTTPSHAQELLALNDEDFQNSLQNAFETKLGKIIAVQPRHHFPLRMRHAKNYIKPRIALIGDAAHTIHPLAGQGLNLGLLDAACLTEVIAAALAKKRDFASIHTLRRYERWRKSDNMAMLAIVEMFKNVFMSDKKVVQSLRSVGLNFTDRISFLKNYFAKYGMGNRSDLPELAMKQ